MEEHGMDYVYQNLWVAVLKQAIEDVSKYPGGIISESILSLNPESIKKYVYQVISETYSIAANNPPMEFRAH
jgi:hypothetical protein